MGEGAEGRSVALRLPYVGIETPVLYGESGLPMLPVHALCAALGLNWRQEYERAHHLLLWHSAYLLPYSDAAAPTARTIIAPERADDVEGFPLHYDATAADTTTGRLLHVARPLRLAWCLPYPVYIGYWLGQVYGRVRDPAIKPRLLQFIRESDRLGGRLFEESQQRFVAGRKRLRQLPITVVRIEAILSRFREVAYHRLPPAQQIQFDRLELRAQGIRDQAETFARAWFAYAETLPRVETVRLDGENEVIDEPEMSSMFGVFSRDDEARLLSFEDAYQQLLDDLGTLYPFVGRP